MFLAVSAFGLATAFGQGWSPLREALEEQELPFFRRRDYIGSDYQPQKCAFQSGITLEGSAARIKALLGQALDDLATQVSPEPFAREVALLLSLPGLDLGELAPERLLSGLTLPRPLHSVEVFTNGQGASSDIFARAAQHSAENRIVLLCAADSLADPERLNRLNAEGRLFSKANPYALIPGEAAGAVLLLPEAIPGRITIIGAAQTIEEAPEAAMRDSDFAAMSAAAHEALSTLPLSQADALPELSRLISDWNNSRYRAAELAYTMTRITPFLKLESPDPDYPAQLFGDTGAAWPVMALAMFETAQTQTALALSGNYADGRRSAVMFKRM